MNSNRVADRTQIPIELPRQQFLRFQLQQRLSNSVAHLNWSIEIDRVTELVNILIDRVVPMPHLPPAVMGVYNWRGEILWVIDLATLLEVNNSSTPRRHRSLQPMLIINSAGASHSSIEHQQQQPIGLIVDEISEIEWCNLELINADLPVNIHPKLSKWVTGSWRSSTGENLPILNGKAICFDGQPVVELQGHN
jgi:positive phototaxis protein PixI